MAVVLHLVGLIIRTAGIVHRHDEGAVEGTSHNLLIERLGGVFPGRAQSLAVLVLEGVGELLWRFADGHDDHPVYLTQHAGLGLVDGVLLTVPLGHVAQLEAILTELRGNQGAHLRGVVAAIALRHHLGRHQPVLLCQVGDAAERAAITYRTLEEEAHTRVVDRQFACIDTALKHQVGLLQLIPDKEISLGEFQLYGIAMLAGIVGAQHIEAAEHPATSR